MIIISSSSSNMIIFVINIAVLRKVQMYRVYLDALNTLRISEVYQKSDKV